MNYYPLCRRLLFCLPPEAAHRASLTLMQLMPSVFAKPTADLPVKVFGLRFPNPVGLAAGFDRHGDHIASLSQLGFGFLEVGTVTPRPQSGNPKPRIFRLPKQNALINRVGFYSKGLDHLLQQLTKIHYSGILGINIGKNKETPLSQANADYITCLEGVYPHASYISVNISSPNTPGLRELQAGDAFESLLSCLKETQTRLQQVYQRYVPLIVKLAPELDQEQQAFVAEKLICYEIDGAMGINTSLKRPGLNQPLHRDIQGGLSGAPLMDLSVKFIKQMYYYLGDKVPLIALGGIQSGEDAKALINAGARLVQVYTGLIYQGPCLINDIVDTLRPLLQRKKSRV